VKSTRTGRPDLWRSIQRFRQEADLEERLRQLAAQDLVVLPAGSPSEDLFAGPRVPSRGKSASEMVLEDRR